MSVVLHKVSVCHSTSYCTVATKTSIMQSVNKMVMVGKVEMYGFQLWTLGATTIDWALHMIVMYTEWTHCSTFLPAATCTHVCLQNDSNWKWSQYLPVIANSVQLCCLHFEEKVHCWELLLSRVHSRHCLTYFNVKVSRSVLNKGDIWNWLWRVKTMSCIGEYDQKLCNLYLSR